MSQTWFVTGASRGFGLGVVAAALERGDRVVATARDPAKVRDAIGVNERLLAVAHDVCVAEQTEAAVAAGVDRFGAIDVLLNNAGHGLVGAIGEVSDEEARAVFDVNVFGLLGVTRAVLPVMRAQGYGHVMNVSSGGGLRSNPSFGLYCATKFAVEAISESLSAEVADEGIRVTLVEPGSFRTDFLDPSSLLVARAVDAGNPEGTTRATMATRNHRQPGDPAKFVEAILMLSTLDDPPLRLILGPDAVAAAERKLAEVQRDLDAWRPVSMATDTP